MARPEALLEQYRAKRDFSRTAEPQGHEGEADSFVVQMHDATRLHWDFRLELDGVLKSWAVTRGPSIDPADKRLAVRTEDHPLAYGGFEGTIPKGQYGGGTVLLWDRGRWEPIGDPHEGLAEGHLKFRLFGERMHGVWALVRMKPKPGEKRENWLLVKDDDVHAVRGKPFVDRADVSVVSGRGLEAIARGDKSKAPQKKSPGRTAKGRALALPEWRSPQLATLVDAPPEGGDWLFEMKYDGYRSLAAVSGDKVRLFTRTGKDWTTKFGHLVEPFSRLTSGSALIDGEICAFDARGRTDFSTLKAALTDGGPLVFFAFDLLEQDGERLEKLPLVERKVRLKALLGKTGEIGKDSAIQFSDHIEGNGDKVFDTVCRAGHEGIIAKQADAPYRFERTRSWLKVKCTRRQEFVIGGWSPSTKTRSFASLLLGTFENDELVYRGRVGTGFSESDAEALLATMKKSARKTSPFGDVPRAVARTANWVAPEMVAEIAFSEFTPDGLLRHPSFLGLREDKPARQIGTERSAPVAAVAGKTTGKTAGKAGTKGRADRSAARDGADLSGPAGIALAESLGIRLTSPDRVAYPDQGITKAQLVAYYGAVADRMLPLVVDRPLSLLRCPQGRARYCFFQKHDTGGFPDALRSVPIVEGSGAKEDYFYIPDLAGIIAGVQMNVLEFHLWGARRDKVETPERLVFDIDPDAGLDWEQVRQAAYDIRDRLSALGLMPFAMVSGGKGIHVIAPLRPRRQWPEVKAFCRALAQAMADEEPARFTANLAKARRKGRMFIDYLRNERGATAIAPYSVRARAGAPVATPVTWDELAEVPAANHFSLAGVAARMAGPDPWQGYAASARTLTQKMLDAVGADA